MEKIFPRFSIFISARILVSTTNSRLWIRSPECCFVSQHFQLHCCIKQDERNSIWRGNFTNWSGTTIWTETTVTSYFVWGSEWINCKGHQKVRFWLLCEFYITPNCFVNSTLLHSNCFVNSTLLHSNCFVNSTLLPTALWILHYSTPTALWILHYSTPTALWILHYSTPTALWILHYSSPTALWILHYSTPTALWILHYSTPTALWILHYSTPTALWILHYSQLLCEFYITPLQLLCEFYITPLQLLCKFCTTSPQIWFQFMQQVTVWLLMCSRINKTITSSRRSRLRDTFVSLASKYWPSLQFENSLSAPCRTPLHWPSG